MRYKEGFRKQIFQFANELTNIVNITKKSFSCSASNDGSVVDIDSDTEDCVAISDAEDDDDSCLIVEPRPGNLEFQAVEDVVILDSIKEEPNVEPEEDPLSLSSETFIKPEPLEIKIECRYDSPSDNCGGNKLKLSDVKGTGVTLLRCDLCPYTSKHSRAITTHKWRMHKVKKNKKICSDLKFSYVKETGVVLYRCDLCPYTSKHSRAIATHKWQMHKVKKKKNIYSESNQPVVADKFRRPIKCDLCPFTTKHARALGPHKHFVHKLTVKKNKMSTGKYNVRSLTPAVKDTKVEGNVNENERIEETQKPQFAPQRIEVPTIKKCSHCPFETKFNHALAMHKKIKHLIEPDRNGDAGIEVPTIKKCSHCPFETKFNHALAMHKKIKHLIEPDRNGDAGKKIHGSSIKKCSHCPFKTKFNAALAMHKKTQHPIQPERYISAVKNIKVPLIKKCPHCPFKTKFSHALTMHKKIKHSVQSNIDVNVIENNESIESEMKNCPHCPYKAKNNKYLIIHKKRVHFIEPKRIVKPNADGRYECQQCNSSFSFYHNLLRHINNRHVGKTKRKCPYCGKSMVFEFQLRRHIEKNHPIQWKHLKMEKQNKTQKVQEEHSLCTEETAKVLVEKKEVNVSSERSKVKHNCQFCSFKTEDFHILGLHKQVKHTTRKVNGKDRVLKCLFCSEICSFRSEMIRHAMSKHPGAWLKMERNAQQSDLRQGQVPGRELDREPNTQKPSNTIIKLSGQNKTNQSSPMSDQFSETNNSNSSWKDVKVEEEKQTEVDKKFCGKCERFYHPTYYSYHTCKKHFKCDLCSFKSLNKSHMHLHRAKVHSHRKRIKVEDNSESKNQKENQKKVVKRIARAGETSQEHVKNEAANTDCSSVSEMNDDDDDEYMPSSTQKRVSKPNGSRKTCNTCKRSYNTQYFNYHRCMKMLKCSKCSYTVTSFKILKLHQRIHHTNLKNESLSTASIERENLIDNMEPTYSGPKEEINLNNMLHQEYITETDENNDSPNATLGNEMVYCKECNSSHNYKYLWKYVCYKENIIHCNMCSFMSSSQAIMERHKKKQHSKGKLSAGNVQRCRSRKCQFCPLLFSSVHQLKNHLSLKHVGDQEKAKTKFVESAQVVKSSQHPKPTTKSDNTIIENDNGNNHGHVYEASTSSVHKRSLAKQKGKKTCPICCKSYNRVYYRYHRCEWVKLNKRGDNEPSEIQPIVDIAMERIEQQQSIATETIESTSNSDFRNTQPPSKIVIEENKTVSEIEGNQPPTNSASEGLTPPTDATEEHSEVQEDKMKCENCKMYFKSGAFQSHNCRPILRCQKCTFKTRIKKQMTLHDRKHLMEDSVLLEESLYQCKICKKKFASQSLFMHHKVNECKKKPFHQCPHCRKKFYQKKNLDLHILQIHSENNDIVKQNDERKESDESKSESPCPLIDAGVTNTE